MVCSAHFKAEDIVRKITGRRDLKRGAVPSVFDWTQPAKARRTRKTLATTPIVEEPTPSCSVSSSSTSNGYELYTFIF